MALEVSIVIPTFNEYENISILVPKIHSILQNKVNYEIIIVDDNSPDGTWRKAEELARKYGCMRVFRRVGRRGLASAILNGIALAKYDLVIVMDADLQHPPEAIPEIVEALSEADIVIASRYVKGGGIVGWSATRRLISFGATILTRLLFPKIFRVRDPMSGFFGVHKSILRGVRLNPIGFKILFDILVKANYRKIKEVPYIFGRRKYGQSKLSGRTIKEFLKHVVLLLISNNKLILVIPIVLFVISFATIIASMLMIT